MKFNYQRKVFKFSGKSPTTPIVINMENVLEMKIKDKNLVFYFSQSTSEMFFETHEEAQKAFEQCYQYWIS